MYSIEDTEQRDKLSSAKKPRTDTKEEPLFSSCLPPNPPPPPPARAIRLLKRKYPLTTTGYKYLAVGISVDVPPSTPSFPLPSCVQIVIGDSNKKEHLIDHKMWLSLVTNKDHIERSIKSLEHERVLPQQIELEHRFSINLGYMHNLPIVRVVTPMSRFTLSVNTMTNLLSLDLCVARIITALQSIIGNVDAKMKQFLEISPDRNQKPLYESDAFERKSIVDCEIAALYFYP